MGRNNIPPAELYAVVKYIAEEGPDVARLISGTLGVLSSVAYTFLLTPPSINVRFWSSRPVEDYSPTMHLVAFLNSLFWVLYGLPFVQLNIFVIISNAAGCLIAVFYLLHLANYSKRWNNNRWIVIAILVLEMIIVGTTATIVLSVAQDTKHRCRMIWIIASTCQFGMLVVLLSKTVAMLCAKQIGGDSNGPLAIVTFLNSSFWTTYALLSYDLYLAVPNLMGFFVAIVMIVLYVTTYGVTERRKNRKGALVSSVASSHQLANNPSQRMFY